MSQPISIGIDTFGDVTEDGRGGTTPYAQTVRDVVDEGVLTDQVGLDTFNLGEHHRDDFAVSAPEVVLGAIAARTSHVHLSSAVTVLSSDDPVRVFERFSEVDAISGGRAEIIVGRGSFIESFPLFGYSLQDYEQLFNEKLAMLVELLKAGNKPVTWPGTKFTQRIKETRIYPPIEHGTLKTWVAVGGSPESVIRAAKYRLPLMLAIIGGPPVRFRPFVDLYRKAWKQLGNPGEPEIGFHSPGYIAENDAEAATEYFAHYVESNARLGKERGWRPPTREAYEQEVAHGAMMVGAPETVARRIAGNMKALGATRFDLKQSMGRLSHAKQMASIELFGTKVAPLIRDYVADPDFPAATA